MFVCLFFCKALLYELKVPRWDFQTGRQLRTSPLYDRLDTQGARWMEKHGFERPKYFVPPGKGTVLSGNATQPARGGFSGAAANNLQLELELQLFVRLCVDLLSLDQSKTFYKPDWFDIVGEEVKCCKEAVCVIDMSSFTKFEVTVSQTANCLLQALNRNWVMMGCRYLMQRWNCGFKMHCHV